MPNKNNISIFIDSSNSNNLNISNISSNNDQKIDKFKTNNFEILIIFICGIIWINLIKSVCSRILKRSIRISPSENGENQINLQRNLAFQNFEVNNQLQEISTQSNRNYINNFLQQNILSESPRISRIEIYEANSLNRRVERVIN